MQVTCIRPFGNAKAGDVVEVPDGAEVDPAYWQLPEAASPPPGPPEPGAPEVPASSPPAPAVPEPAHFPSPGRFAPHSPAKEGAS